MAEAPAALQRLQGGYGRLAALVLCTVEVVSNVYYTEQPHDYNTPFRFYSLTVLYMLLGWSLFLGVISYLFNHNPVVRTFLKPWTIVVIFTLDTIFAFVIISPLITGAEVFRDGYTCTLMVCGRSTMPSSITFLLSVFRCICALCYLLISTLALVRMVVATGMY